MRVKFFTSSHGKEEYGLPAIFEGLFGKHFERFGHFEVDARGGRMMTDNVAQDIINDIQLHSNEKQVIIISLGGNDLRPRGVKKGQTISSLLNNHRRILEAAVNLQWTQVVVVGVIPCPRFDYLTKETFKSASFWLKKTTRPYKNGFFVNIANSFVNNQGIINKQLFIRDGIHMSPSGQSVYANRIFQYVLAMPKL